MVEKNTDQDDSFVQFNQARKTLANQFYDLIGIVGNHVFNGNVDIQKPNMLEEIKNQPNLLEPEKNVLRNLYFYSTNLLASRFLLGVVGRFKAGKSTVLNALSGENISPMDTRISTGVLNFTYRSDAEECIVIYDSGQSISISPAEKRRYVDCKYNPDNEKGVHSVRHGSPRLDLQKEIEFVDTPGLEAVNNIHEKITLDFMAQCHAAIVVSTYPPFGETELRFYERIKTVIPNIFLVQNLPADKMSAWVELEAQTLTNLHKLGFYELHKNYGGKDIREILSKIADYRDEKDLDKFKELHGIHIYSLNARDAYQSVMGYLFSIPVKYDKDLGGEKVSEDLCRQFKQNGHLLSLEAFAEVRKKDEEWLLADKEYRQQYLVIKEKDAIHIYGYQQQITPENAAILERSRFPPFKEDLYQFLAETKGKKLIETYLMKGRVVLSELIALVDAKLNILQKSLEEITLQIQQEEQRKFQVQTTVNLVADRAKLKLMETYKRLKTMIMEEDMRVLLNELNKEYGESNVYRLRKDQIKAIKNRIGEFKRQFSQRHQDFYKDVQRALEESKENVLQALENHGVLGDFPLPRTSTAVGVVELTGAGLIEDGFKFLFHGGMALVGGSLAGGGGTALLTTLVMGLGIGSGGAGAVAALIGGAIGLGISFPLEKYVAPILELCKGIIGRLAHKPTRAVFDQFRAGVREKLDEIEAAVVDRVIVDFKEAVVRTSEEYLQLFAKTLQELKSKKESGLEHQEFDKLTDIVGQLEDFRRQFEEFGRKQGLEESKMQGMLKGIKGFIKKFTDDKPIN